MVSERKTAKIGCSTRYHIRYMYTVAVGNGSSDAAAIASIKSGW